MRTFPALATVFLLLTTIGAAQTPHPDSVPLYKVDVVQRTIDAVNYQYKSGPTPVDLKGTVLLPEAKGNAVVESKAGRTEIDAHFDHLVAPQKFGREYLTYVLWAITPEGRPHNLSEIIPGGSDKAKQKVTTDLQAFGLLVTAEPYAAVRQPSGVVVMENEVRPDTLGKAVPINVHYELMAPGHYTYNVPSEIKPAEGPMVSMDEYTATLELYQAQNAVDIAKAHGAVQYAPDVYRRAEEQFLNAQRLHDEKADKSSIVTAARAAYETAEDARVLAEKRKQDSDNATAEAKVASERQLRQAAEANAAAAQAQSSADREALGQANAALQLAQSQAQAARQQADEAAETAQAAQARPPVVVVAPPPPLSPSMGPVESTGPARDDTAQRQLRASLLAQLSGTLEARDTPRGIVVTVPDSDFHGVALNTFAFGPLARVARVISSQPGLAVEVDGNSDAPDGARLSDARAESVREALIRGGLLSAKARGLGDANRLGPNVSAAARAANRRVEIVISGPSIGGTALWDKSYTVH